MGRHVIFAFGGMDKQGVSVRNQSFEEAFQVAAHVGVGVFLDQQRGRCVPHMQGNQSGLQFVLADPALDLIREFIKSATSGRESEFV